MPAHRSIFPALLVVGFSLLPLATVACEVVPGRAADRVGAPDLDSARAEMAVGRYWHAARHLRALRDGGMEFGPAELLLLARADAGYRYWEGVTRALEGQGWLAEESGGLGFRLLGLAHEAAEEWTAAAEAYAAWLDAPDGRSAADRPAIEARRARVLARAGRTDASLAALDAAAGSGAGGPVAAWMALELAGSRADRGDTATTVRLLERVSDPAARDRAWELEARARMAAGDTAGAVRAYGTIATDGADARRARANLVLGEVALARGDTDKAVGHFEAAVDLSASSSGGITAGRRLVETGRLGSDRALVVARALQGAGATAPALRAYEIHAESAGAEVAESARLARARLLAAEGRSDEAVAEYRALSTSEDSDIGAGALDSWIRLRRGQGRTGDVQTLRGWLVERYPSSDPAVEYVFLRGDAAHDRLEWDAALTDYGRLTDMAPSAGRTGLARMRVAQIHLQRGDSARALEAFLAYTEDFPDGRRWDEASYWAGRVLAGTGRRGEAETLWRDILEREPLSYYSVLAAEQLGEEWAPPGDTGGGVPELPEWMAAELHVIDLLHEAGLETGRKTRTDALTERALESSLREALRLARELIERDHGLDGINLGWAIRGRGMPWNRALLEVTYPFPHREMVYRAASERGLDPLFVASLIRQESAYDPDIVSRAGAVGLMQIMPATGRELASAVGPDDFTEASLVTPEINLHLGTRFLVDLNERFGGELPLILSAYNAGPHRADAWLDFPEAADMLRFIERIPYGETRDYVKAITRNMALYGALYGRSLSF